MTGFVKRLTGDTIKTVMIRKIIITEPPLNCWAMGYPVSDGGGDNALCKASLYANQNKIIPDQKRLKKSFLKLRETLKLVGLRVVVLKLPSELDTTDGFHHDGVFVRDVGMMFKNYWIKAHFNAKKRQPEAEAYAKIIHKKFKKKLISLPKEAFLEFGEVYYLQTSKGSFYFGGLSRANTQGHNFVKNLIKPEHFCLIKSKGYHLDTVFTPVISAKNELIAVVVAKNMLEKDSFEQLAKLNIPIITINNKDSSDKDGLGNYAVNCLVGKGFLISGSLFSTPQVEERLKKLGIKHCVVPLVDYNFSGGSAHCLTNEIYE